MKKILLIALILISNLFCEIKVESMPDFHLNKHKNIYVYFWAPKEDNIISGITVNKIKPKVMSMLKGLGYDPIEVKNTTGNKYSNRPILVVKMVENYFEYKTGGYSYNTYEYVPGETYRVNSYGTGGYSTGMVQTSGYTKTNTHYVPEKTKTAKLNYGHFIIYRNSTLEEVWFANNSYTSNYEYVDLAENLFLELKLKLPVSDYFKPTVKYFGKDKTIYKYDNYIPGQYVLKTVKDTKALKKGTMVLYERKKEFLDHTTDLLTSLVILYPFTKKPGDLLVIDKNDKKHWINRNDLYDYAMIYTHYTPDNYYVKDILAPVR